MASSSSPPSSTTLPPRLRTCSRCDQPSTLLLRKNVPWCTSCAQRAVQQRAKAILDHARGAALLHRQGGLDSLPKTTAQQGTSQRHDQKQKGGVALGFSGGTSSRALLNIATRSLAPPPYTQTCSSSISSITSPQPRKARPVEVTRIDVIYIDDSALIPGAPDETEAVRAIVQEQGGEEAGLHFMPLKLEHVFGDGDERDVVDCIVGPSEARRLLATSLSSRSTSRDLLLSLFNTIHPSSTSRTSASSARTRSEDLAALLTQVFLAQTARSLGCSALLLGDSASRGAINLIDGIAKGRGHKWPVEGATAIWRENLLVLRPLRDCFAKELAFYNRTLRLSSLTPRDLVTASVLSNSSSREPHAATEAGSGAGEKASIGRLTEHFIFHLEKGVPSTVNTVGRTGGKLVMLSEAVTPQSAASSAASGSIDTVAPIEATLTTLQLRNQKQDDDDEETSSSPTSLVVGAGQKGNRLIQGVKSLGRWNGENACPLCSLPAQSGASDWKGKLSIVGLLDDKGHVAKYASPTSASSPSRQDWKDGREGEGGETTTTTTTTTIALEKLLCYACLIILDVPEESPSSGSSSSLQTKSDEGGVVVTAQQTSLPLPPYVLLAARARLNRDTGVGLDKASRSTSSSTHGNGNDNAGTSHTVSPVQSNSAVTSSQVRTSTQAQTQREGEAVVVDCDDDDDGGSGSGSDDGRKTDRDEEQQKVHPTSTLPSTAHVSRIIEREEMRGRVDEFLLGDRAEDEDEEGWKA